MFLSGKIAAVRGRIIPGGIEAETKMVMDNLQNALAKSGLTMDDVVKATVFLNDLNDFSAMKRSGPVLLHGRSAGPVHHTVRCRAERRHRDRPDRLPWRQLVGK